MDEAELPQRKEKESLRRDLSAIPIAIGTINSFLCGQELWKLLKDRKSQQHFQEKK